MDPRISQALADAAARNEWAAIFPETTLALLALALLALELVLPRPAHRWLPRIALAGQIVLAAVLVWAMAMAPDSGPIACFGGLLERGPASGAFRVFFLVAGAFVTWMGIVALERRGLARIEFFHVVLVATAAMMILVQSNHLIVLFVALETVTVCSWVLVSWFRHAGHSLEAGLKYLVLGGLASALLTFGIVLLYGAAGNTALAGGGAGTLEFGALRNFLEHNPGNRLALAGVVLVLCGLGFKIGAVPFHVWVPDVYQGAPTPVTALLAVASKGAGFGVLLALFTKVLAPLHGVLVPVMGWVAAATIVFGNFAALTQRNTKRLLGFSGIAHAGYLLVGVAAAAKVPWAAGAVVFYLFAYLLAAMAVFGVINHLAPEDDSGCDLEGFTDLWKKRPILGAALAAGLGSLAGIPPLAGFAGKALLFIAAFQAGLYWLLGVAIAGVVVSIYYYFGWIKLALFEFPALPADDAMPRRADPPPVPLGAKIALGAAAVATVVLGFFQGPLAAWFGTG